MCQILSWSNWAQLHGFTSAEDLPRCLEMGGERNLPVKCYLNWQLIPKLNSSSKMQKYLVKNPDIIVKAPFFPWIPGNTKDCWLIPQSCGWRPHKHCKPTEIPPPNLENGFWEGFMGRCGSGRVFLGKCTFVMVNAGRWCAGGKGGRAGSDWRLTSLTGLRDGKGRAEPSPQGKRERKKPHALLGNILRGASSASLNGKSPATLGNTKGKWKELAHTTAALWKCLPRKAWDCVKILTDRSVRSDKRWSLDSQLQHFWCLLVGWTRRAHVPC